MRIPRATAILSTGAVVLLAAYPFTVYFLMDRGDIRVAGLVLLAAIAIRLLLPGAPRLQALAALLVGAAFAAAIALTNNETLARLYPVGVSVAMLAAFGLTLLRPPSMIERIARAAGAPLDAAGVRYTRGVTIVWCAFFTANGCVALATALFGSREAWALYNGLLSYVLAGAILAGERLVRGRVLRRAASPVRG